MAEEKSKKVLFVGGVIAFAALTVPIILSLILYQTHVNGVAISTIGIILAIAAGILTYILMLPFFTQKEERKPEEEVEEA